MDKGFPGDPRFPERDNEFVADVEKRQKLLVEWFEDFKSKFSAYKEAVQTMTECDNMLAKSQALLASCKGRLEVQNALNARKAQGSVLEYGFSHFMEHFNGSLEKGMPGELNF